tara:strand:+ start:1648 stop:2064 length:417 start_codon:yes stop_codon:yes gene_type:complete
MFNKIFLLGNLGADPELKTGKSGKSYCRFSIATTSVVGGEKKTEWFRCTAFGRTGDALAKYCSKGQTVFVEGRVEEQKYTDKNGNPRSNSMVIALSVQFLAKNTSQGSSQGNSYKKPQASYTPESVNVGDDWDEEVPF